jgi:transposase-like protein
MRDLTREDVAEAASLAVGDRIRHAVKAVLEQLKVPRDRDGTFTTRVSSRSTTEARASR